MHLEFWVNIIVPIVAGVIYFIMAYEIKKVGQIRGLIFGEIGYRKVFSAFVLLGIYFITRPLQNIMGPHPWPMLINNVRQFFLMSIIAPAILVGIFYWDSDEGDISRAAKIASYSVGFFMAIIFILVNRIAIDGSKVIASFNGINLYDAVWFSLGQKRYELILIHLFAQFISPVGFFVLATAIVRRRRHNYPKDSIYNLMPLKWKYLEIGLEVFVISMLIAGVSALLGHYYTYLWMIYYVGAIISGAIELKSVKILPSSAPSDLGG
ncbi:MAG: hypothetical protein A2539_06895 [Elusimicrobia bacterium RIFOXYD2_FULL_34_15]|nr:MAG: hypothetical protein A2539_06895 [Elusimicrobia bacterium RIFOXYD2_FULL_34_15]